MKDMMERGQTSLKKYLRILTKINQIIKDRSRGGQNQAPYSILRGFIRFMNMMIYLGADVDQNDLVNFNYFTIFLYQATCPADWTLIEFYQSDVQALRPHLLSSRQ